MREMINSGQEWLGNIPANWDIAKIDSLYKLRNTKVSDYEYEPLSVTMSGVVPQLENAAKTNAHDDRKLVLRGDFAINSRSDRRGSCGISEYDGSVSLINTVLKPKGDMVPRYFNWLFHTKSFADEFYRWGHGIVDDLWTTNWQDMRKIVVSVPSMPEQKRIASFLDSKCSEIDYITADIQKEIETLQEYRKSVITEAVTKGLDPNVEMKDSGIVWIGMIPKHWDIYRAKHVSSCIAKGNGITKEQVLLEGDIQCVRYGEIYSKYEDSFIDTFSKTNLKLISSPKYIKYGDILFAGTGELVEEIGKNIVFLGQETCLAGGDIVVLSTKQDPRYLNYSLGSIPSQAQKSKDKAKLKVVHISSTDIGNIKVAIPPYEEQIRIANYLDIMCSEIDSIIEDKQKQLGILAEYRKSLIYEYVTGKKEVPAV